MIPPALRRLSGPLEDRVKKSALVRDLVRERRLRAGQPDWRVLSEDAQASSFPITDASPPRRVLLATVGGGYLAGTRVESLLAAALSRRGAEVHVLLCDGMMPACFECNSDWYPDERRFAREGPTPRHCNACFEPASETYGRVGTVLHRYSELVTPEEARAARESATSAPVSSILDCTVDGVRLGEHAQAGTLRFLARATIPEGPQAEAILRRYFEAAILTRHATDRLLASIPFGCSVFHHGIYVPQGVVGDVARARGVRVVNWHVAYRKGCFIFSHDDTYHHTLLSEPTSEWEDMRWSPELDRVIGDYLKARWSGAEDWISFQRGARSSGDAVATQTGVDFSKPCIGMLTNVMWDAQLHYPANAFPSMLDWAVKTVEYFRGRPDLELLIRVHPAEVTGTLRSKQRFTEALREVVPELPPNVHVVPPESRLSTYAAMERCNAVIIYGTKTGVELAATGMPVIVAGEAWVRGKGITLDADSEESYFALLDRLPLPERLDADAMQRARQYAYHFFFRRMIPISLAKEAPGVQGGFVWEIDSPGQLERGATPGLDVICNGILEETPFIYAAEEQVARAAAE